ncbi:MAG TPA: glycosyltransferase family 4 protein [Nitrososphaerales archaeon]|nr:glycosyltransferase family 4 protein [Nitrososphaerales archaeon]
MTKVSISIVSGARVYPLDTGQNRRISALAEGLASNGLEVRLFVPCQLEERQYPSRRGLEVIETKALNGIATKYPIGPSGALANLSAITRVLKSLGDFAGVDIEQVELLRTAAEGLFIAKAMRIPCVLDEHNVEALLWYRMGRARSAWKRLAVFEGFAVRNFTRVLAVSQMEKRLFCEWYGIEPEKVLVISNGVDTSRFDSQVQPQSDVRRSLGIGDRPMVYFMGGDLVGRQNSDALRYLLLEIWPRLKKKEQEADLVISGTDLPQWLDKGNFPGVRFVGRVEDVVPYINAADVCVAPLRIGAGTRLRILEYLSCGKAVVSTSVGAEGLDLVDGRDFLIRDGPDEFASGIQKLISDEESAAGLGREGQSRVRLNYSWTAIVKELADYYREMVSE